jgi:anti-sigma regulatory factor (Ser/Thr protein kinase)
MERELLRIITRCDPGAPGVVRGALSHLQEPQVSLGDAILVASELVANAVRHSCCATDDLLRIEMLECSDCLEIAVSDPGTSGRSAERVERQPGDGGLGLQVVEQLTRDWGAERHSDGYRVWAQLAFSDRRPAQAPAARRA